MTNTNTYFKRATQGLFAVSVIALLSFLSGCGEDAYTSNDPQSSPNNQKPPAGIKVGTGVGDNFIENDIFLSVTRLSAGGSTSISINIVDSTNNNNLYKQKITANFSSDCSASQLAIISPAEVITQTGTATATYEARGCSGTDTVTVTISFEGSSNLPVTLTKSLAVEAADVGTIINISIEPPILAISGSGGLRAETATLKFKVFDNTGGPVSGQDVTFRLSTLDGGITFTPETAKSNLDGMVQVSVTSGTKQTTVTILATVTDTAVQTSAGLVIASGLPDSDSFSIAVDQLNPNTFHHNGVIIPIRVDVGDHANTQPVVGIPVAFKTEGGKIINSCQTDELGQCTVNWISSEPRPADGRVTILATVIGEESYLDTSPSNGLFDDGETFGDLDEVFRDDNENGIRDSNEEYIDFNNNEQYDLANGKYNGTSCAADSTLCDKINPLILLQKSAVIVMSTDAIDEVKINIYSAIDQDKNLSGEIAGTQADPIRLPNNGELTQIFVAVEGTCGLAPSCGQPLPVGTVISASTTIGSIVALGSITVPNTSLPGPTLVSPILDGGNNIRNGILIISVNFPNGSAAEYGPYQISVEDRIAPKVINTTPAIGSSNIPVDTIINVFFDKEMNSQSINTNTIIISKPSVANSSVSTTVTYDSIGKKAVIDPIANLEANTSYVVTVISPAPNATPDPILGVEDFNGNPLNDGKSNHTFTFTTAP